MVCEFGMASELGAVTYGQEDEPIFIGKEIARHKDYSEETARLIDQAVRKILDDTRCEAQAIIAGHRDQLDLLTEELLKKETLDDAEIRILFGMPPAVNHSALAVSEETAPSVEDAEK